MDRLWAPWRKAYIRPENRAKKSRCLFCDLARQTPGPENHVFLKSRLSFAVLNLYPYNNGHVMIVPRKHTDRLSVLSRAEKLDWLELYQKTLAALQKTIKPHGFNVGMNLGTAAGAGIPKHLHLHIVPRWNGDTNFMPVLSGDKVISESLGSVYRLLSKELKRRTAK